MARYEVTYQRPGTGKMGSAAYRTKRFKTMLGAMNFVESNDWPIWQIMEGNTHDVLGDRIPRYEVGKNKFLVSEKWWPKSIPSQVDYYETYERPRDILSSTGLTESEIEKFMEDKKD